jgi:glycosyltransferase involved in cell wall biosynthesis
MLDNLKKAGKDFKSIYYYPIDGIPKEAWIRGANSVDFPVTYTEFGREQSVEKVPEIGERLRVIPHGVNPDVFFPVPEDQVKAFREQYFGPLAEKFIITNVNRNQQRKDIPATIKAFIEFKKERPDSVLYLHMAAQDQGWNLPEVIAGFGLNVREDVILPQRFTPSNGFPLEVLNLLYNSSDCLMSTTVGEGWGLSWTEAMACKTPVVYPLNTCLGEYITEETGFPFKSGGDMDHITVLPNDNEIPRPTAHISDAVKQLLLVHDNREEAAKRADAAYKMVHNNLIWNKQITPQWIKLFDEIGAGTAGPRPIADLDLAVPVLKGEML